MDIREFIRKYRALDERRKNYVIHSLDFEYRQLLQGKIALAFETLKRRKEKAKRNKGR